MTTHTELLALAERVEAATGADRTGLRNAVALAIGWHRVEPRFTKSKNGAWIKPSDFLGVRSDGSPVLDSLHGTDMHRDPPNYLESLDAAVSLYPVKPDTIPTDPRKATAAALRARATTPHKGADDE